MFPLKTSHVCLYCLCALLLILTGCSGGSSLSAFERTKATFEDDEYEVRYTDLEISSDGIGNLDQRLAMINAAAAYARGATGAGETVIIYDSGIRETHREFVGKNVELTHPGGGGYKPNDRQKSHGTFVASIAVGNRNGFGSQGVAYEADLNFFTLRTGSASASYRLAPLTLARSDYIANFVAPMVQSDLGAIINFSLAPLPGAISEFIDREKEDRIREKFQSAAAMQAQAQTDDADKKIIVWGAGNAGDWVLDGKPAPKDSPELSAGLGYFFPELQTHVIAVVSVKQLSEGGDISDFSNRCGIAKAFCIAAPGENVVGASSFDNEEFSRGNGTSFSAPVVSGALAVMRHFFRNEDGTYQLGNTELVARMLATANRKGIYENSDIYGHGLLDLDAATAPVGVVRTGLPEDADSRVFAGSEIALAGGAFGNALQHELAGVEVAAFDELGAPFFEPATRRVTRAPKERKQARHTETTLATGEGMQFGLGVAGDGEVTEARLALDNGWWFGYGRHGGQSLGLYDTASNAGEEQPIATATTATRFTNSLAFAAPYLSLVRDGPGAGWVGDLNKGGRLGFALMHGAPYFDGEEAADGERGFGVLLDYRPSTSSSGLSLQAGFVRETDGVLGARAKGAFGAAQGDTAFAGLNSEWRLGDDWHLLASAWLGHTRTEVDNGGMLREMDTMLSSAFSLGAAREAVWRHGDWLGLQLSQPLRTEYGHATLRLPAGRTKYRETLHREYEINLKPAGRTVQAEAAYQFPITNGAIQLSAGLERHPQHDRTRDVAEFVRLHLERRF